MQCIRVLWTLLTATLFGNLLAYASLQSVKTSVNQGYLTINAEGSYQVQAQEQQLNRRKVVYVTSTKTNVRTVTTTTSSSTTSISPTPSTSSAPDGQLLITVTGESPTTRTFNFSDMPTLFGMVTVTRTDVLVVSTDVTTVVTKTVTATSTVTNVIDETETVVVTETVDK